MSIRLKFACDANPSHAKNCCAERYQPLVAFNGLSRVSCTQVMPGPLTRVGCDSSGINAALTYRLFGFT